MAGEGSGVLWSRGALVGCMLASYAVAVYCRLAAVPRDEPLTTMDVTTADGYGWLSAVSGQGTLSDHVLARAGRALLEMGLFSVETLSLYAPVLVGALAAPLLLYWVYTRAGLAGGIFAGILGMQLPVLYVRTGLGYFDTDAVIIPLLVAVIVFYESWFDSVEDKARRGDASSVGLLAGTLTVGIGMYLTTHVHIVFALNAIALFAVSTWLYGASRLFCLYVLVITLLGPLGLVLVLLAHWVQRGTGGWHQAIRQRFARHRPAGIVLVAGASLAVLAAADAVGTVDLLSRFESYVYEPLRALWQADSTVVHVQELAPVSLRDTMRLLTGNVYLSVLGLVAVGVAVWMNRGMILFLFPLMLGMMAPVIGKRFVMFGALVIVLGGAVVLARLVSYLSENPPVQFAMLGLLGSLYCYQLFQIYAANPPRAFAGVDIKRTLQEFEREPGDQRCDLVLSSWGKGYLASYYTGLPAVLDGSNYPVEAVSAHSSMMLAGDEAGLQQSTCQLLEHQKSFIRRQAGTFDCRGLDDASRLFVVVTWDDVLALPQWTYYANGGGDVGSDYMVFEDLAGLDYRSSAVPVSGSQRKLASLNVLSDGGVETTEYPSSVGWHLIVNKPDQSAVLVSSELYESFLLKTLLGRNGYGSLRTERRNHGATVSSARLWDLCPRNSGFGRGE